MCGEDRAFIVEFVREWGALCEIGAGYIHRLWYLRLLTVKCQQSVPNTSIAPTTRRIIHKYISNDILKFRRELYTYTANTHLTFHTDGNHNNYFVILDKFSCFILHISQIF